MQNLMLLELNQYQILFFYERQELDNLCQPKQLIRQNELLLILLRIITRMKKTVINCLQVFICEKMLQIKKQFVKTKLN
mgnify:CR=1 FL=1